MRVCCKEFRRRRWIVAALFGVGLSVQLMPTTALSGEIETDRATCTTINCGGIVMNGTLNAHQWNLSGGSTTAIPHTGAGSWVMLVRAGLHECLRLDILSQGTYTELVVVSPSAVIWRNSARGTSATGCAQCPLVKIASTSQSGYYVVQVNHRSGTPSNSPFKLAYGRYNTGNANCANPTAPLQ
jgi:hypothetical protein